jgi:hypothetical protein
MSTTLLLTVTGLALLDSLNPATILGVALILVLPSGHPVRAALAYVLGAYVTVLGLGAGLYLAADAAAGVLDGGLIWVRRIAFGLAALMLLRSALQRLRQTHRTQITLPTWFTPGQHYRWAPWSRQPTFPTHSLTPSPSSAWSAPASPHHRGCSCSPATPWSTACPASCCSSAASPGATTFAAA